MTGRSSLKGDISTPAVLWQQFIGARENLHTVKFGALGSSRINLAQVNFGTDIRRPAFDHSADPSHAIRYGHFLPGEAGLQKLEFENGMEKYGKSDRYAGPLYGRLMVQRGGRWVEHWRSEPIPWLYLPLLLTGDFDNDGRMDLVVEPWYDLWMMDVETGKLKTKVRFTVPGASSGRGYGFLGAYDLDGDGKQEFVMISDFDHFIEVVGWRDGKLTVLWHRLIEGGIIWRKTIFHAGSNPMVDVDGDGKLEIAVTVFNEKQDRRWHVLVLDALKGATKLDLPDKYLAGTADLDDDGVPEMFLSAAQGVRLPPRTDVSVASFKGGRLVERWRQKAATFQMASIKGFPDNVRNRLMADATIYVLAEPPAPGALPVFFTRTILDSSTELVEVTAWQVGKGGQIGRLAGMAGPYAEVVPAKNGDFLLRTQTTATGMPLQVSADGAVLMPVFSHMVGTSASTPLVARLAQGRPPSVVIQTAGERIQALQPHRTGTQVEWTARGRAMRTPGPNAGGVLLADLRGNREWCTVAAGRTPEGAQQLVAFDSAGKEIWHYDFQSYPQPAVSQWFAGHFTDRVREDVLVSFQGNSLIRCDETFLLDGRTGEKIWGRDVGTSQNGKRAFGQDYIAVYDHDGDGLDDAVIMSPVSVFTVEGRSGVPLLDRSTVDTMFPGLWVGDGIPIIFDFLRKGRSQMLYGASTFMLALLDANAKPLWNDGPMSGTPATLPAVGDIDGDGRYEIISPGHRRAPGSREQNLHCYDAETGKVKWKLELPGDCFGPSRQVYPATPTTAVSADIDGDGREEAVFSVADTLYAVGTRDNRKAGEVRWSLRLRGRLGPPAIADVEGNGRMQIVVASDAGYLYGIGQASGDPYPRHINE